VLRYLNSLSAFLFYLLGGSVFAAYLLHRNAIWPTATEQWMLSIMLPLLTCSLLYGGTSLYLSVQSSSGKSTVLATILAIVSLLLFSLFAALTFWPQ